jgi:FkbM family methyltransferase
MRTASKVYNSLPAQVQPYIKRLYYKLYEDIPKPSEDEKKWMDVKNYSQSKSPTVIDGGAHKGETIDDLTYWFSSPEIHAFEPNPHNFDLLKRKYGDRDNIHIYQYALANKRGTMKFNITKSTSVSSLLEPTEDYQSMFEGGEIDETVEVETRQIDDIINKKVDIVKLDLQGYEYFVLKGARNVLQRASIVVSETMFNTNYSEQKVFRDLDEILYQNGFQLKNFYKIKHWPNGQIRHADVLYTRQ